MPAPERIALAHHRERAGLVRELAREARRLWRRVDFADIRGSWRPLAARLLVGLTGAQLATAQEAERYVGEVLDAQGVDAEPDGLLIPRSLAGIASDGRDLATLLEQPAIGTLMALATGETQARAMAAGYTTLDMIVRTQVADAGRVADGVALASRPLATGYVRMVVGVTCSRCIVLAGRWYRWNTGFERHPRCDCIHIPAAESTHELRTDPKKIFESLDTVEQDRVFTKAGAQAIRDGADISQVVNARRGAAGLTPAGARITDEEARQLRGGKRGHLERVDVFGRQLFVTTDGTTVRGLAGVRLGAKETGQKKAGARLRSARAPRLMPESIYEIAGGDRDEAIRLLKRFGYIR